MSACGPFFSDLIYFGTSGWSPALGGILNPANCSMPNTNNQITRFVYGMALFGLCAGVVHASAFNYCGCVSTIAMCFLCRVGDVCVSPFSVDWVCKKSSWSWQAAGWPNQCFRPQESQGPNATYLYGECQFYADNVRAPVGKGSQPDNWHGKLDWIECLPVSPMQGPIHSSWTLMNTYLATVLPNCALIMHALIMHALCFDHACVVAHGPILAMPADGGQSGSS